MVERYKVILSKEGGSVDTVVTPGVSRWQGVSALVGEEVPGWLRAVSEDPRRGDVKREEPVGNEYLERMFGIRSDAVRPPSGMPSRDVERW